MPGLPRKSSTPLTTLLSTTNSARSDNLHRTVETIRGGISMVGTSIYRAEGRWQRWHLLTATWSPGSAMSLPGVFHNKWRTPHNTTREGGPPRGPPAGEINRTQVQHLLRQRNPVKVFFEALRDVAAGFWRVNGGCPRNQGLAVRSRSERSMFT